MSSPSPSTSFSPPLPPPLSIEEEEDLNNCLEHLFREPQDYITGISDIEIEELLADTPSQPVEDMDTSSTPPKQINLFFRYVKLAKG